MITKKEIYEHFRGMYYCNTDEEDETPCLCEAYEDWPTDIVEEEIDENVTSMIRFLKEHNVEVEE